VITEATFRTGGQGAGRESFHRSHADFKLVASKRKERSNRRTTPAARLSRPKIVKPGSPLVKAIMQHIRYELKECEALREECPVCCRWCTEATREHDPDKYVTDEEGRQIVRACTDGKRSNRDRQDEIFTSTAGTHTPSLAVELSDGRWTDNR